MTQIMVDDALQSKLKELTGSAELVNAAGKVLGRFVPLIDLSEWEPVSPEISEEELRRREQSKDWVTYEQMMEHLKSLEKQ